ncbi:carboxypeptidase regulatory-like domain-containing protein [Arundinibacter roseus]|uniref:Fibronectin type-III domain-containing protein n=1 Tax=Arundinibacter roseus TaxID=2070510 RepID=A0A4R4KC72_9BACT|nr:carboxypeptidase regulatory-like domain-containing protein [Arundinibacter roseus]TDB64051.1 hypothetical protein EZE20_14000 [Arundinibacter roseus]
MLLKVKYLASFLIVLSSIWLLSCSEEIFVTPKTFGKISGKVIDNSTKKALGEVLIRLNPSGRSLETDTSGTFFFDSLTVGKYTITATKEALYNEYVTVEITDTWNPNVTLYMSEDLKTNRAPTRPLRVTPENRSTVAVVDSLLLSWTASDPDRDTLTYDVYLYSEGTAPDTAYISGFKNDSLYVSNLEYSKRYYWQVVARDKSEAVFSETWSFVTPSFPALTYVFSRETEGLYQIFSANTADKQVQLTTTGSNWRPIVSPNREQIAFISNRATTTQIYLMNRDGRNLRKVTSVPVSGLSPLDLSFTWAYNGSKIIYPSNNRLYSINTDGTGLAVVATAPAGRLFAGCDWNEATKTIIARTTGQTLYDNELVLIQPHGEMNTVLQSATRTGNPVFSIEGTQILYSRDIGTFTNEEGRQLDARIFLMNLFDRTVQDLSAINTGSVINTSEKSPGTNDLEPRYSPTGRTIIFTNTNNDGVSPRNIWVTDSNGRGRTRLFENAEMGTYRQQP